MNRQCYRLVFNKAKGLLVATSEVAARHGKGRTLATGPGARPVAPPPAPLGRLRPLPLAVLTAMGLAAMPAAQAQILPDRQAPGSQRPHVVESANGIPQVNITTPSAQGVSRNTYRQFDVDDRGAILNNSRRNAQTQIGGWVQGNPNLAAGEARVIVNEVNSRDPSQLRGHVEVAGQRAEVVIANPAGIQVDGAGFINAGGVTLTTGAPEYRDGALTGYRVEAGSIQVAGAGLDTRDSDYTAILARAVEIQGAVVANELEVVAGANEVSADRREVTPVGGQGTAPEVAIDVAHLGGMYAGKIHLLATDAGVGVRNAGELAAMGAAGEVVVSADGRITNQGQLASQGELRVTSRHGVDNTGLIRAGGAIEVTSEGPIANRGEAAVIAGGDVRLQASGEQGNLTSERDTLLAAGVQADGRLGEQGDLTLEASESVRAHGNQLAAGGFYAQADTLSLRDSHTQAHEIAVASRDADLDARGATLAAESRLSASTPETLRTDGARVQAERLDITADGLSNRDGELIQSGDSLLSLDVERLDNRDGRLASNGAIEIAVDGSLANAEGDIASGDALTLAVQGELDNTGGRLWADALDVSAVALDNTGGTISAAREALAIRVEDLDNTRGRLEAAESLHLDIADTLTNEGGAIVQAGAGELHLATGTLAGGDGLIASQGALTLQAGEAVLDGATTQAERIAITARRLSHRGGELLHLGSDAPLLLSIGQALDNTQGLIAANAALDLTAGELGNRDGVLQAASDADMSVASLDNRTGELVSGGTLALTVDGGLDNAQGRLESAGALILQSRGLDNRGGTLIGDRLSLATAGQRLDNTAGLIAARDTLDLTSGVLDNTRGTLQAGSAATIDTRGQALINADSGTTGGILANESLALTTGDLDNTGGLIGGGALAIDAGAFTNREGILLSEGDLALASTRLDNASGQLQALNDLSLTVGETLDNRGGLLRAGGTLTLDADRLVNSATQGYDQGVEGQSVRISADTVDNRQGAIRADQRLEIDAADSVANRDGLISSRHTLVLTTGELANRNGTLIADRRLDLTTARLAEDGRVLSLGDLALRLASDFTLGAGGELMAQGDILLTTTGTLTNHGTLRAGDTLDLTAREIVNAANGEMSGTTTVINATQRLTNRGLIDGVTTRIDATTLDNLGGGRIYGDWLGIQAGTLTNAPEGDTAPVIAARERLDIGVGTLLNRDEALIFSAGDLAIGGDLDGEGHATGQANRVHNASATIEALGNLSLATQHLLNSNEHFATELVPVVSEETHYLRPSGRDEAYAISDLTWDEYARYGELSHASKYYYDDGSLFGVNIWEWTAYDITRNEYETTVTESAPGRILAGGDLRLSGGELINDKSQIVAGGTLFGDLGRLENREAWGVRYVEEQGLKQRSWLRRSGCEGAAEHGCGGAYTYRREWSDWTPHDYRSAEHEFVLPISEVREGTASAGSGLAVAPLSGLRLEASAQGAQGAQASVQTQEAGGIIEVPAWQAEWRPGDEAVPTAPRLAPNAVIRTLMPSVQLPVNALFRLDPAPTAPFLVETDPRFTDRRQWLSSAYMLETLERDHAATHKRLGDGFYEQRLIREQILQLTGQRFLAGHTSDDAQYRALMNAGITVAEAFGLRPGVALTGEQMAQLTSDIVWLVEREVTLPNGTTERVLVPQVYVRVQEGDLKGDGTLIAGNVLALDVAGNILNSGTLAGRELVSLTADNLANLGGGIQGNRVDLTAHTDLLSLDGRIEAQDALSLQAGRDLTVASSAERLAGLYVTGSDGTLSASAGRDLSIIGADLTATGDLSLGAGRDLSLAATELSAGGRGLLSAGRDLTLESLILAERDGDTTRIRELGTRLAVGGDLSLRAGQDLTARAAEVSSGGDLTALAGRDLTLDSLTLAERGRGFEESRELGTRLEAGGNLSLLAGQDLTARAAEVSSGGDLVALAGRDLTLEAGLASRYAESRRGGTHTLEHQTRVQGSEFVAGGELSLGAGRDLTLIGSRVQAGGDATLSAGRDLSLLSAEEEDYSLYESSRRSGLLRSKRTERHEVHEIRAVGSEAVSGGDLTLRSGGDQTYQAARLAAGDDLNVISGGEIRFEAVSDLRSESHERSKRNFAWQSARGQGETLETLRQSELVAQGQLAIQAADGIRLEVEEVNQQTVNQTINAMVEANPDLAWLQDMEARGDIDWREVKTLHDEWRYSQSGLGEGAALAVAIVAAATGQYYALAALGGTTAGVVAVTASAAAGSLAGTAAVSVINNRGNLGATFDDTFSGDSLRSAAIAAVSAGVTQGVTDQLWGTTTTPTSGATSGLDLGQAGDIGRFAGQRATQAAVDAGIRSAIEGGSFRDHLGDGFEDALAHVVSGVLFHAVGDQAQTRDWAEGSPEKIALHALVGGAVSEAMGGDFRSGALAAGANEALVEQLAELVNNDPTWLVTASQLVGIVAAEMTNGDVNDGAFIAGQSTRYNYLTHQQVDAYAEEALGCEQRGDCDEVQERYRQLSLAQQDELIALCATDAAACASNYRDLVDDAELFRDALDGLGGRDIPWQIGLDAGPLFSQYMEAESVVSQEGFAQFLQERHGLDHEQASVLSAMAVGALGANSRVRPVGGRLPINSKYANSTVPLEDLPREIRQKYPHSVPFSGAGFPDFTRYSIRNVRIELGGSRAVDFRRADRAAGFTRENPRPVGYTWHHHQDSGYMQLVPTDLHDAIRHTGGIATGR